MDFDIEMDDVVMDTRPVPEAYTSDIVVGEEQVRSTRPHGNWRVSLTVSEGARRDRRGAPITSRRFSIRR